MNAVTDLSMPSQPVARPSGGSVSPQPERDTFGALVDGQARGRAGRDAADMPDRHDAAGAGDEDAVRGESLDADGANDRNEAKAADEQATATRSATAHRRVADFAAFLRGLRTAEPAGLPDVAAAEDQIAVEGITIEASANPDETETRGRETSKDEPDGEMPISLMAREHERTIPRDRHVGAAKIPADEGAGTSKPAAAGDDAAADPSSAAAQRGAEDEGRLSRLEDPMRAERPSPRDGQALAGAKILADQVAPAPLQGPNSTLARSVVVPIAENVEWRAASGVQSSVDVGASDASSSQVRDLRIQLNPAELGTVTARLRISNEQLSVEIAVEQQDTLKLVQSEREAILTSLRGLGFKVDDVTIVHHSQASSGDPRQDGSTGQRGSADQAGAQQDGRRQDRRDGGSRDAGFTATGAEAAQPARSDRSGGVYI